MRRARENTTLRRLQESLRESSSHHRLGKIQLRAVFGVGFMVHRCQRI
jgi:hypothetical protein